jgi:DNA-binding response OmpR family regulator
MNIPRILVVDDDPSIRNFVQANLVSRGYQVLTAAEGEEAVGIAESENDREKCAACGANDYLTKPFVLRELLNMVKTMLKKQ